MKSRTSIVRITPILIMSLLLVTCLGVETLTSQPSARAPQPAVGETAPDQASEEPSETEVEAEGVPDSGEGPPPGANILVVEDGDVRLKRSSWSDYHPTTFGAELHRGDLLLPADDATAVVLCDDLGTWSVPTGTPLGLTYGCPPPPEPVLRRGESRIGGTRGGSDPNLPFVISPRKTRLLDGHPLLQWNEVPGATSYQVVIQDADTGNTVWETTADRSGVAYPGDPPLQPGYSYLLIVEADNDTSSRQEGLPGLGFSLLSEADAGRVRSHVDELTKLHLPPEAEAFALARLYASEGLLAEAIEALEALTDGDNQLTAVYRLLGDLYCQVDLSLLAELRYRTAIELAETAGDTEGLAAAQAGLGAVTAALGRNEEAVRLLEEAKAGYEALGDTQRAEELAEDIANLGP